MHMLFLYRECAVENFHTPVSVFVEQETNFIQHARGRMSGYLVAEHLAG
jgi:hypothetical protein